MKVVVRNVCYVDRHVQGSGVDTKDFRSGRARTMNNEYRHKDNFWETVALYSSNAWPLVLDIFRHLVLPLRVDKKRDHTRYAWLAAQKCG